MIKDNDLFLIIDAVSTPEDEVKEEALKRVLQLLYKEAGSKDMREVIEKGLAFYRSPVLTSAPPFKECIWIGTAKDPNGKKLGGGLFKADEFIGAYTITIYSDLVRGKRETHVNTRAEIHPITRDDLIDLLYEDLFLKDESKQA